MVKLAIGIALVIPVLGCNAGQPRLSLQERADLTCQGYGAKPGTDAYVNCRAQVEEGARNRAQVSAIQRQQCENRPSGTVVNGVYLNTRSGLFSGC